MQEIEEHFFHMFANGDDAKNFITSEQEFKLAFNRFGVCAYLTGATVISFSVEDTHPHALLWGTRSACTRFKEMYECLSLKSIARRRGTTKGVLLECELDEISDESYLMNVGTYTIVQATKDGKAIMPYDYRYGTGALYFRSRHSILPWLVDDNGTACSPMPLSSLTQYQRREICGTREYLPSNWLVCNGFILPTNYVDIERFESIYRTHNCFRAFLSSKKSQDTAIMNRMSDIRGVTIEDLEAKHLCADACRSLFGRNATTHLDTQQRISLARTLRIRYRLSYRQLSALVHLPETELRKYVR